MTDVIETAPDRGIVTAACNALGLSRSTLHRRQIAAAQPSIPPRPRPKPARSLSVPERETVITLRREPHYVDLAPAEVYATLRDQGVYHSGLFSSPIRSATRGALGTRRPRN